MKVIRRGNVIVIQNLSEKLVKQYEELTKFVRKNKIPHIITFDKQKRDTLCAKVTGLGKSPGKEFRFFDLNYFSKENFKSFYLALSVIHYKLGIIVPENNIIFTANGIYILPVGDFAPFNSQIIRTNSKGKLRFLLSENKSSLRELEIYEGYKKYSDEKIKIYEEDMFLAEKDFPPINFSWKGKIYIGRGGKDFEGLSGVMSASDYNELLKVMLLEDFNKNNKNSEVLDAKNFNLWLALYKGKTLSEIWKNSRVSASANYKSDKLVSSHGEEYNLLEARIKLLLPLYAELLRKSRKFKSLIELLKAEPNKNLYMRVNIPKPRLLTDEFLAEAMENDKNLLPWYIILSIILRR